MARLTPEQVEDARLVALRGLVAMLGWTQEELAEAVGIGQPYLSEILMGVRKPAWETFERICVVTITGVPHPERRRRPRRRKEAVAA